MRKLVLLGGAAALVVLFAGRDGRRASAACPTPRAESGSVTTTSERPLPRGPRPSLHRRATARNATDEEKLYRFAIVDGTTGRAISDAGLFLLDDDRNLNRVATSDARGHLELALAGRDDRGDVKSW